MQDVLSPVDLNERRNHEEHRAGRVVLESFPYHIQIGADNRCNLRCGFCLAEVYRAQGRVHIQDRKIEQNALEIFERLQPFMRFWKFLSLTGPGESLLNPRLDEVLKLVRDSANCTLVVTTNGVLINARLARIMLDYRVDEVSISLDSISKELFEEIRVNGKFERAVGAIRLLNAEKEARGADLPRVNLTPTFMRKNIHELPGFIDFARDYQINVVQASPLQVYRKDWMDQSLLHYPDLTRKMAVSAERRAEELGVCFVNNLRMVYTNRGSRWAKLFRREEPIDFPTDPSDCLKPWRSLYVEPDGEVRPCCYQSPVYGNLFEEDFETIWNGSKARALRQSMLEKNPPTLCRNCYEFNRHRPQIMIQIES